MPNDALQRAGLKLRLLLRSVKRRLALPAVRHQGVLLPPAYMRYCGATFKDDDVFLESGRQEARRLVDSFGLSRGSRLLEVGCGPGRLPIGILAELGEIERYLGIDLDRRAIRWCRRYISKKHPTFEFHRIDARHERYNPHGREMTDAFALPFENESFDLVYLHSVFANMLENDIRVYCNEFRRLLVPSGRVFLTAFVEEGVPPITINPEDYHLQSTGPQNIVRYERSFFLTILTNAGFEIERFAHGVDQGGQSAIHLRRIGASGTLPPSARLDSTRNQSR